MTDHHLPKLEESLRLFHGERPRAEYMALLKAYDALETYAKDAAIEISRQRDVTALQDAAHEALISDHVELLRERDELRRKVERYKRGLTAEERDELVRSIAYQMNTNKPAPAVRILDTVLDALSDSEAPEPEPPSEVDLMAPLQASLARCEATYGAHQCLRPRGHSGSHSALNPVQFSWDVEAPEPTGGNE